MASRAQRTRPRLLALAVVVALALAVIIAYLTGRWPFTPSSDAPQTAPIEDQQDRGDEGPSLPEPTRAVAIDTLAWLEGDGRAVEDFVDVTAPLLAVGAGEEARPVCTEASESLADTASPRALSGATARIPDRLLAELHLASQDARVAALQHCGADAWDAMAEEQELARQSDALIGQRRRQLEAAAR